MTDLSYSSSSLLNCANDLCPVFAAESHLTLIVSNAVICTQTISGHYPSIDRKELRCSKLKLRCNHTLRFYFWFSFTISQYTAVNLPRRCHHKVRNKTNLARCFVRSQTLTHMQLEFGNERIITDGIHA